MLKAEDLLRRGDWKMLRFLKEATPQDIDKQEQVVGEADLGEDSPALEDRPDGLPDLGEASSQFGSLLTPLDEVPKETSVAVPPSKNTSTGHHVPKTGRVKKERLKNSRQVILVPDGGDINLLPGGIGPRGYKIVQIQCFSDAAIGVIGKEINKKIGAGEQIIIGPGTIDEFVMDERTGKRKLRSNVVKNDQVYYLWKSIAIYEEKPVKRTLTKLLPVEEALRPPWFSPLYSNWFIGSEIYDPFLGTGSVVDQALFVAPTGAASFGASRDEQEEMLAKVKAAGNDQKMVLKVLQEAEVSGISNVPDIESSLDVLAYIYGEVVRQGLDVHRFVNDYTKRPIASLEQILGSSDLRYEEDGDKLKTLSGVAGFHSTAVADFGELKGLLDNPDLLLNRLTGGDGKKAPVNRGLDPRPGRRKQVEAYLQEIGSSGGVLGVGVAG
jgi:hypothetical protein